MGETVRSETPAQAEPVNSFCTHIEPGEVGATPPARGARWGGWEFAATVLFFCFPAVIAYLHSRKGAVLLADWVAWIVLVSGVGGALALTLVARGIRQAQAFLTVGVLTCAAWFFVGHALGQGKMLFPYAVLIPALLVVYYHTVPFTLFRSLRRAASSGQRRAPDRAAARTAPDRMRGARRLAWGVVGSVVALDLVPTAYLVAPERWWKAVALVWMMLAVAAGGMFTTLAAWRLPRPARLGGGVGGPSSNGEGAGQATAASPLEDGSSRP